MHAVNELVCEVGRDLSGCDGHVLLASPNDKCSSLSPSRVQPCGFRVSLNDMLAAGMVLAGKIPFS